MAKMTERIAVSVVLLVLLAALLGTFFYVQFLLPDTITTTTTSATTTPLFSGFYWGVNVGEELSYEIKFYHNGEDSLGSWHPEDFVLYDIVNDSKIVAVITQLPTVDGVWSSSLFQEEILETDKIECRYENGTVHPGGEYLLNSLMSHFILPLGSWSAIEAFYPFEEYLFDEDDSIDDYDELVIGAINFDTHFFMAGQMAPIDDWVYMQANVTLSSGVPFHISWGYSHGFEVIELQLTLI